MARRATTPTPTTQGQRRLGASRAGNVTSGSRASRCGFVSCIAGPGVEQLIARRMQFAGPAGRVCPVPSRYLHRYYNATRRSGSGLHESARPARCARLIMLLLRGGKWRPGPTELRMRVQVRSGPVPAACSGLVRPALLDDLPLAILFGHLDRAVLELA